jgi:hypothetical protein
MIRHSASFLEKLAMMRWMIFTLSLTIGVVPAAYAATTTFEDLGLPLDAFLNNAGASGQFVSGGNSFNNAYNARFDSWSGWAISSTTDTTTADIINQYSAIAGSGAGGSPTYGVAFTSAFPTADLFHPADSYIDLAAGTSPASIQVTNTTYTYLTMKNGDPFGFTHAFGPGDFLLLDIRGYNGLDGTGQLVGEVDFYLANFLDSNSLIVDTWQTLDLSSLAGAESLRFGLRSNDNDPKYGMNTPAYVAVDDLQLNLVPEPSSVVLALLVSLCLFSSSCRKRRKRSFAAF